MLITIKKDGSLRINSGSLMAHYDEQGKLMLVYGDSKAPRSIEIKDEREKKSVGFSAESFGVFGGQVFIDASLITSATISIAKVTREDKLQEENVWRGGVKVEQERSVALPNVIAESALANAQEMVKVISKSEREREEREQKIEQRFSELQSQITSTQLASASDIDMLSARISNLDSSIADINSAMATSGNALREEIAQVKANLR